jgi:plastocyanin domain-containing protein
MRRLEKIAGRECFVISCGGGLLLIGLFIFWIWLTIEKSHRGATLFDKNVTEPVNFTFSDSDIIRVDYPNITYF